MPPATQPWAMSVNSDLVRENNHADVAEDRPDVDQPSQTTKGARESVISVATLPRKAANDDLPGAGRDSQSIDRSSTAAADHGHDSRRFMGTSFRSPITRAASPRLLARSGLEQTLDLRVEIHGDREC